MQVSTDEIGVHFRCALDTFDKASVVDHAARGVFVVGVDDSDPSNLRLFVSDGRADAIFKVSIVRES